jgi:hypothetical protein
MPHSDLLEHAAARHAIPNHEPVRRPPCSERALSKFSSMCMPCTPDAPLCLTRSRLPLSRRCPTLTPPVHAAWNKSLHSYSSSHCVAVYFPAQLVFVNASVAVLAVCSLLPTRGTHPFSRVCLSLLPPSSTIQPTAPRCPPASDHTRTSVLVLLQYEYRPPSIRSTRPLLWRW